MRNISKTLSISRFISPYSRPRSTRVLPQLGPPWVLSKSINRGREEEGLSLIPKSRSTPQAQINFRPSNQVHIPPESGSASILSINIDIDINLGPESKGAVPRQST